MGISLSHARYEEIKQIVVDLFVKYDVSCVPVNGFELATKMGIKVIPYRNYHQWMYVKSIWQAYAATWCRRIAKTEITDQSDRVRQTR